MSEESAAPVQQTTTTTEVQTGQAFTIPNTVADPSGGSTSSDAGPALADIVPEEYKDKGYMSKIKDIPGLFKSFDSAQEMLGKRPAGIPHDDAGEETWNDFYKQLGRPDTAEGYDIKLPEDLPEGLSQDNEQLSGFKEMAHKLGLTPKQVQALVDYDVERQTKAIGQYNEQSTASQKQVEEEFNKLAAKAFGDRMDKVLDNGNALLKKYAPKEFAEKINSLDNTTLISLAAVLDGISRDYISEDQPLRGDAKPAQSQDEALTEARRLMQSEAYRNPIHVDHDLTRKKVESIYQNLYGGK